MGKIGKDKRPRDGQRAHHANLDHKKQKMSRDHVQNTLAQSLHEASASSDGLFSEHFAAVSQQSFGILASSPPRCTAASVPHVPPMKQVQPSASHFQQQRPENLPQLPEIVDKSLETAVFTHPHRLQGHNQTKITRSYDRLEFLGDAYIELIASRLVYSLYPHMPAGRLSQQRESIVKNECLASYSIAYGLDKRAHLPPKPSTVASPSSKHRQIDPEKQWTKILGDIFEAYIAAVVLSNAADGFQIAERWLQKLWIPKLKAQNPAETRALPAVDAKQALAKRLLGTRVRLNYRDCAPPDQSESSSGKTWYTIGVFLTGWGWNEAKLGEGKALNKKEAGMIAATQALKNPLTEQIAETKKEFDHEVAKERAAKEQELAQPEEKRDRPGSPNPGYRAKLKEIVSDEDKQGEISDDDDSNDSDKA